MIIHVLIKK